jgi:hypothetical protein
VGAGVGRLERGHLQRGETGDRGADATSGADTAGVVDHHGGVGTGDAKIDAEQANR